MTSKKEKQLLHQQAKAQIKLEKFLNKIHSRIDPNISDEDLDKQIVEAIHEMRRKEKVASSAANKREEFFVCK